MGILSRDYESQFQLSGIKSSYSLNRSCEWVPNVLKSLGGDLLVVKGDSNVGIESLLFWIRVLDNLGLFSLGPL